ncbi:cytosol aminopeptidase [Candidatus Entotheonellaceae bacterium PAL068K]
MKVVVKRSKPDAVTVEVLIVPIWHATSLPARSPVAQLNARLGGLISDYLESGNFPGTLNSTLFLHPRDQMKASRLLLVGLGKSEAFSVDHLRQVSASAATTVRKLGVHSIALLPPTCDAELTVVGQTLTEGALLGRYKLQKYKTTADDSDPDHLPELHLLAAGGRAR